VNTTWNSEDSFWKRTVLYSAIAAVVVIGGGALYYFKFMKAKPVEAPPPVAAAPATPEAPPAPEHHEVAPSADTRPLPALNESDGPLAEELGAVVGKKSIDRFLVPEQLVRHIVVTVDNLPRTKVAVEQRPVKATAGETVTVANGDTITLSADNYARYASLIKIVQNTNTQQLGALYLRYYPLFQQAYEELGHPNSVFNTRLLEVIRHLLATPDPPLEIRLTQPSVQYKFADERLEKLSAGQKVLIRMGRDNAQVVNWCARRIRRTATRARARFRAAPPSSSKSSFSRSRSRRRARRDCLRPVFRRAL